MAAIFLDIALKRSGRSSQATLLSRVLLLRVCHDGHHRLGRRSLAEAVGEAEDLHLVGGVARGGAGTTVAGAPVYATLADPLATPFDVLVDYTAADVVKRHALAAAGVGRHVVIGSSGLTTDDFAEIDAVARADGTAVLAVGSFAITAALLERLAAAAAGETVGEVATRGAGVDGTRIHSMRLPGYTIGLEVRFGQADERLTISCDGGPAAGPYVAGTLLAIRRVYISSAWSAAWTLSSDGAMRRNPSSSSPRTGGTPTSSRATSRPRWRVLRAKPGRELLVAPGRPMPAPPESGETPSLP